MPLATDQMILVNDILERDHDTTLEAYLIEHRRRGESHETIARDLTARLDITAFAISYQTIRRWCNWLEVTA